VCGKEIESITHVLKECEETRGEISEEEFFKENGKGWEVKRIEEVRRKKINEEKKEGDRGTGEEGWKEDKDARGKTGKMLKCLKRLECLNV